MAITYQREMFCQHYAQFRSGPAAYIHAFNVRDTTAVKTIDANASKLLSLTEIQQRIDELVAASVDKIPATFTAADALKTWLDIAFADPNELIGMRVGACRHCYGEGHKYQWKEHEFLEALERAEKLTAKGEPDIELPDPAGGFGYRRTAAPNPECPHCEGDGEEYVAARDTRKLSPAARLLFGGVKKKRDGVEIIIADQKKALENACRILGAFNDGVKLDGSLGLMAQVVQLKTDDPNEAARLYQEMIRTKVRA